MAPRLATHQGKDQSSKSTTTWDAYGQYIMAAIAKTLGVSRASIYRHLVSPGH